MNGLRGAASRLHRTLKSTADNGQSRGFLDSKAISYHNVKNLKRKRKYNLSVSKIETPNELPIYLSPRWTATTFEFSTLEDTINSRMWYSSGNSPHHHSGAPKENLLYSTLALRYSSLDLENIHTDTSRRRFPRRLPGRKTFLPSLFYCLPQSTC